MLSEALRNRVLTLACRQDTWQSWVYTEAQTSIDDARRRAEAEVLVVGVAAGGGKTMLARRLRDELSAELVHDGTRASLQARPAARLVVIDCASPALVDAALTTWPTATALVLCHPSTWAATVEACDRVAGERTVTPVLLAAWGHDSDPCWLDLGERCVHCELDPTAGDSPEPCPRCSGSGERHYDGADCDDCAGTGWFEGVG